MPNPSSVSRRWLYIPWAIAAILLLIYYGVWRYAANEMKTAVVDWAQAQESEGVSVTYDRIKASGFPFLLRVRIEQPSIDKPGEWRWRGDGISLHAVPTNFNRIVMAPEGQQVGAYTGIGEWALSGEDMRGSIAKDKALGWKAAVTLNNISAHRDEDNALVNLKNLVLDLAPNASEITRIELNAAATGFVFASAEQEVALTQIRTTGAITQTHTLEGENSVENWRRSGGVVFVDQLSANFDADTSIAINGRVFIDTQKYPAGSLTAKIVNPGEITRALAELKVIKGREAEAAATGLTFMAAAAGGKITLPIKLKNGQATLGGIPVGTLSKIE